MSVYKRGNTWWVQIKLPGGQQSIRQSAHSTRRADALTLERKLQDQVDINTRRGILGLQPQRNFGDALVKYIESGNAPRSMASHIKQVAQDLRHTPLDETPMIQGVANMKQRLLNRGLNPQTINRRLSVIQRVLNLAYKEWRWLERPMAEFISPMRMSEK